MKQKAKVLNYQKKCGQERIVIKERDVALATNVEAALCLFAPCTKFQVKYKC